MTPSNDPFHPTPGAPSYKHFSILADLGPETEWFGNTVRPIMVERVSQVWRDGRIVDEQREIVSTGRMALVLGS
jgi:hypothetical protein